MDWHDDLRIGCAVTGDMPRKSVHVRDQLRTVFKGRRSADAASPGNANAGRLALEGSQDQFRGCVRCILRLILLHLIRTLRSIRFFSAQIEACPVYIRHRILEQGGRIGQKRHRCRIRQSKFSKLRRQELVVRRGALGGACDQRHIYCIHCLGRHCLIRHRLSLFGFPIPNPLLCLHLLVVVIEELQVFLFHFKERPVLIVRNDMELRIFLTLLVMEQFLEVIEKSSIVDFLDKALLFLCQCCPQIALVDQR